MLQVGIEFLLGYNGPYLRILCNTYVVLFSRRAADAIRAAPSSADRYRYLPYYYVDVLLTR